MPNNKITSKSEVDKKERDSSAKSCSGDDIGIFDTYMSNKISLRYFLSKFMITPQDIDDISQETFLRAFREEKKRKIDHPKAFLFRIAKNLVLSQFNKKLRKITDYIEEFEHVDVLGTDSAEDHIIGQQKLGIYCEAVATLPEQCRRVVLMKKIYGMSHKEISARLGISISTVEKHMAKGIRQTNAIVTARYKGGLRPIRKKPDSEICDVKQHVEKQHD